MWLQERLQAVSYTHLDVYKRQVYSCVGLYPKNVDQIAQESRVEIRKLMSILVTLELQGYIREITKNYYIRIK